MAAGVEGPQPPRQGYPGTPEGEKGLGYKVEGTGCGVGCKSVGCEV